MQSLRRGVGIWKKISKSDARVAHSRKGRMSILRLRQCWRLAVMIMMILIWKCECEKRLLIIVREKIEKRITAFFLLRFFLPLFLLFPLSHIHTKTNIGSGSQIIMVELG